MELLTDEKGNYALLTAELNMIGIEPREICVKAYYSYQPYEPPDIGPEAQYPGCAESLEFSHFDVEDAQFNCLCDYLNASVDAVEAVDIENAIIREVASQRDEAEIDRYIDDGVGWRN